MRKKGEKRELDVRASESERVRASQSERGCREVEREEEEDLPLFKTIPKSDT